MSEHLPQGNVAIILHKMPRFWQQPSINIPSVKQPATTSGPSFSDKLHIRFHYQSFYKSF